MDLVTLNAPEKERPTGIPRNGRRGIPESRAWQPAVVDGCVSMCRIVVDRPGTKERHPELVEG